MRSIISRAVLLGALGAWLTLGACSADIHDNVVNIPNAKVSISSDADVDNVQAGQPLPINIDAEGVFAVDPGETPPPEHASDAVYFRISLDDEDDDEMQLVVTAQASVTVTVPQHTEPGHHKVICRVHKHDGTPTSASFELSITVKASISS